MYGNIFKKIFQRISVPQLRGEGPKKLSNVLHSESQSVTYTNVPIQNILTPITSISSSPSSSTIVIVVVVSPSTAGSCADPVVTVCVVPP